MSSDAWKIKGMLLLQSINSRITKGSLIVKSMTQCVSPVLFFWLDGRYRCMALDVLSRNPDSFGYWLCTELGLVQSLLAVCG